MGFIGRLIRLPLRLVPPNRVVRILTGGLRGWKWVTGSATHGAWIGTYEREAQRVFHELIRPGAVVYDIGANVGFFTLLGARLAGDAGFVYAFEPLPRNVELLERHLALNGVANARVLPVALSSQSGTARFHAAPNAAMGALSGEGELEVRVETLDALVRGGTLRPPTFLKIDVEGAEHDVLAGGEETLRRERPSILLSTHGSVQHARCVELLERFGFTLRLLRDPASDGNGVLLATAA